MSGEIPSQTGEAIVPQFPGFENFAPESASEIQRVISDLTVHHANIVREICTNQGIGFTPDGYPDTQGISAVEAWLVSREKAIVVKTVVTKLGKVMEDAHMSPLTHIMTTSNVDQLPDRIRQFFETV